MNNNNSPLTVLHILVCICTVVFLAFAFTLAYAEDSGVKQGAKKAGHAAASAVHDASEGAEAAKEGGKEFARAVKGER